MNFHLDDVTCTATETKLGYVVADCLHSGVGNHNCRPGIDNTAVICTGRLCVILWPSHCVCEPYNKYLLCLDTTCMDDTIHLVGGRSVKEGRVQVCYKGEWYSICSDNWSVMGAEAVLILAFVLS